MEFASPCRIRCPDVRQTLLIVLMGALTACASGGQLSLRDGTLRTGIGQKAFLTEWGLPQRTLSVVNEEQLRGRWGGVPVIPVSGERRPLDLWVYEKHGVELAFDDRDLVGWKTDRSVDQLRVIPQPPTTAEPYAAGSGLQSLEQGLLRVDIGQKAFRNRWGEPDRVIPIGSDRELEAQWGPETRGSVLEGRRPLDIWVYERYGVELLFDDGDLAAWKTRKTVEELRAVPTRK